MSGIQPTARARSRLYVACDDANSQLAAKREGLLWILLLVVFGNLALVVFAPGGIPFVVLPGIGILLIAAGRARRAIRTQFKETFATRIVPLLRDGLQYTPHGSMTAASFNALGLFPGRIVDKLRSEDEVRCSIDGVAFVVEEIDAIANRTVTRGGKKENQSERVFRGLAVTLEFNKHFHGHTVVVPERMPFLLDISAWFPGGEGSELRKITLENPDFERAFVVRTSDEQEARYLLTPRFMELVLEATKRLATIPWFAFRQGTLTMLVSSARDRFELGFFSRITPERTLADLDEVLTLAEQLVRTLDLTTRIWSKQ